MTPSDPTQIRVFLSYARADDHPDHNDASKSFMRRLYNDLTKAGFDVWWDREKMPSRALTFLQEIRDAVATSDKLVLVVGENALISDYVKAEWEFALSQCIPIIPILRQGEYSSIPDELKNYNAPDFRENDKYEERLTDLLRILSESTSPLGSLIGVPELPDNYIKREMLDDVRSAVLIDSEKPVVVTAKQRTTTMHGVGGIGKSTLAAAVGRSCEIRRAFPDGVFWVEMGREDVNPLARLSDIGAHFGDVKEEYRDIPRAKQRLSHILRDKRALIIVDDVWEHQHAEAFKLADVRCRVLVTTRLAGMVTTLGGQDKPLGTLTDQEGLDLFARWLETAATDLPGECALMVEELGGHTQAVNLAAARLKEEGLAYAPDLLRRLQTGKVFTTLHLDDEDKNLNLEKSLYLSYSALSADMQRRFRLSGVFAPVGTFDKAAAQAVWGDSDPDQTTDALAALMRAGLLTRQDDRYSQHRVLRAYARALLIEAVELNDAQRRHFDHYERFHTEGRDETDIDYLISITPDLENLREALMWGFIYEPKRACNLLHYLDNYYSNYEFTAYYPLLDAALSAAKRIDYQLGQANVLLALGNLALHKADLTSAREAFEQILPLYKTIGHRMGQAHTLYEMGKLALREGNLPTARAAYEQALTLYKAMDEPLGQATTLGALGGLALHEADLTAAREAYEEALTLYESINNRMGQANILKELGDLAVREANLISAREAYSRALPIYEAMGVRQGQANTLLALGALAMREDDLAVARETYELALPIYEAIGERIGQANTLLALGNLAMRENEPDIARDTYEQAFALFETIGERIGQAYTLNGLGDLSLQKNDFAAARTAYRRALTIFETIGTRLGQANTLKALGNLALREADLETARASYIRALTIYQEIQAVGSQANCWHALGQVAALEEKAHESDDFYCKAIAIQRKLAVSHPTYRRTLKVWQNQHQQILSKFQITSQCTQDTSSEYDSQAAIDDLLRQLKTVYDEIGVDALRDTLIKGDLPNSFIENILVRLAEM